MQIVVDENVPYGREAFGTLGEVETRAGRAITRDTLARADALVVRSITKVNEALLEGTPVKFVGTCTIGEDHIDKPYLAARGIGFSSAPGCNAASVGQYMSSAWLVLAEKHGLDLRALKLGIVGAGNVGKQMLARASAFGMTCVLNDPPLFDETGDAKYRPLDEIFDCDIVTLHVPLEKGGPHPTWHLADAAFLERMKPGALFVNSSRGAVCDNQALKAALKSGHLCGTLLDVWEGEPTPDLELLEMVDLATPHIAGYSFDGKVDGTRQIYNAACRFLDLSPAWRAEDFLPTPEVPELDVDSTNPNAVRDAVLRVYDIRNDDADMRRIQDLAPTERAAFFDGLRKNYPRRREFFNTRARIEPADAGLAQILSGLGFSVQP